MTALLNTQDLVAWTGLQREADIKRKLDAEARRQGEIEHWGEQQ